MEDQDLAQKIRQITQNLYASEYKPYIDMQFKPPILFRGKGDIKLIVLGQDPTVQDLNYRNKIKVTLLLNQPGKFKTYLTTICDGLGISLDKNVYATNLLKNFFTEPPDQIRKEKPDFFRQIASFWIPLLIQEIVEFENTPIITLGEPALNCLTRTSGAVLIRNFWGYEGPEKYGRYFHYLPANDNVLERIIFPFPHIHGIDYRFYRKQLSGYLQFTKNNISL